MFMYILYIKFVKYYKLWMENRPTLENKTETLCNKETK